MKLLVLSINFAPEKTGFAPHVTALCEYLARHDHNVTVLTGFPFAPYWQRFAGYRWKFISHKRLNNVQVTRLTHFIPRRAGGFFQRLLMEGSFSVMSLWASLVQVRSRWEVILYVGAQPSIAMVARFLSRLLGIPYVVNIQDLAAQSSAGVGIVKKPWLIRVLEDFEFSAYRRASGAMVLCEAFREALVGRGYPPERIRLIRSPVDMEKIRPVHSDSSLRQKLGVTANDFVLLFSGSMGLKQGLTDVVEAARLLSNDAPSVKWVLVGDGELKPEVQKRIEEYNLFPYIRLLPLQPESEMSGMFSSADILLLNQLSSVKDTVIPSKLLTYMAAGKPVLAAVNPTSQAANLIRESQGGIQVPPEDPKALAAAVRELQADPSALQEMGKRNRQYAEEHFDQVKILAAQEEFLLEIVNGS